MRRLGGIAVLMLLATVGSAQPMSGSYTIGGTAPDFATLQDAADAIRSRGVSGPVFVRLRPGVYTRDGGATRLMILDSIIVGSSPANRITFEPDVASGGTSSNVILRSDFTVNTPGSEREIIFLGTDYTSLRNMTFEDVDSMDTPARFLVRIAGFIFWNPTLEGITVEGCTFRGTRFYPQGQQFGTDMGVYAGGGLMTATVTNCRFTNLMRAVSFNIDSAPPGDTLVVSDNRFDHLFGGSTGSGNPLGTAIEMTCAHPAVRRNVVSESSGSAGISVIHPVAGIVEGNYVQGEFRFGQFITQSPSSPVVTDSLRVSNNIFLGMGIVAVRTDHTQFLHNTIIHSDPFGSPGLEVLGAHCQIVNNILLVSGGFVAYTQFGSTDIVSNHNVFFSTSTEFARDPGGQYYTTLSSYQQATGMDTNSHFSDVSFDRDSLGIHLGECEAQDRDLDGVPLAEVRLDYYGVRRDTVRPFIGAVEGVRLPYDMFAAPFRSALPGFALSVAEGGLDTSPGSGIAVPDYDNRQVVLFHNNGANRTFTRTITLPTGFRPTVVRLYDLDNDSHADLIVAGDTVAGSLKIFWGDGSGGFSNPSTLDTWGRVRAIRPGPRFANFSTVVTVENSGFHSVIGYVMNSAGRQLCHDVQYTGSNLHVDTLINTTIQDFVVTNVIPNQSEISLVAPALFGVSTVFPKLFVSSVLAISDIAAHCSQAATRFFSGDTDYAFPVASYTNAAGIASGDVDGDSDNDFITTGFSDEYCVLLRNSGNFTFSADTIAASSSRGLVTLYYDNDGDIDFVTVNRTLDSLGITVFLNDGSGHFTEKRNCHFPFATGTPNGVVAADFDRDGRKDIAIVSRSLGGGDSLYVLYNLGGFNGTTGVTLPPVREIPRGFALTQNFPNPFNPSTRIGYTIPSPSRVVLKVYTLLGQEVATLVNDEENAGYKSVVWDGAGLANGVYFYRIQAGAFSAVKKMLLLK